MRLSGAEVAICKTLGEPFMRGRSVQVVEAMDSKLRNLGHVERRGFGSNVTKAQVEQIISELREEFKG